MTHPTPSSEMQDKLVEILTSIQSATSKASDFALGQLPDIAQSYLAYGRAYATMIFVLLLAVTVGAAYVAARYGIFSDKLDKYGLWANSRIGAVIVGSAVCVICAISCAPALSNLLLVWMAPKVWLLKELAHFIR